jgi:hypothetical protein
MPQTVVNPYSGRAGRLVGRLKSLLAPPVVLNVLILVAILATRGPLRERLETRGIDFPMMTMVAFSRVLPSVVGCLLPVTIVLRSSLNTERSRDIADGIVIVLFGGIVGFYVVGMLMPYASGPVPLTE